MTTLLTGWIDVKDHGAVGDGVTDDTSAIQACANDFTTVAAAGVPCFPPGTYLIGPNNHSYVEVSLGMRYEE